MPRSEIFLDIGLGQYLRFVTALVTTANDDKLWILLSSQLDDELFDRVPEIAVV